MSAAGPAHQKERLGLEREREIGYYDRRWRAFGYANLYSMERTCFILKALLATGLKEPRICDLGCGAGWLTGILNAFGPTVGVELSPQGVAIARQKYPGATFICADATRWGADAGTFDVVVSQEVIEHVFDKRAYLDIARQALRRGGYLILTTPNLSVLESLPKLERQSVWETQPVELPVNRRQLCALVDRAGFDVVYKSSAGYGVGKAGIHRFANSAKLAALFRAMGCWKAWKNILLKCGFGMYLVTVARAR